MVPALPPSPQVPPRLLGALDTLASGVTHELNNLLQVIRASGDVALQSVPIGHPAREHLDAIALATTRIGEALRTLRAATTTPPLRRTTLDPGALFTSALQTLRGRLPDTITLTTMVDPLLPALHGDPVQLRHLLTHLIENAVTALHGTGRIEMTLIARDINAESPGLRLSIADNGPGMPPDVLACATDPYFTTCRGSRHRGLGLALAQQIAMAHGGTLRVVSEEDTGTTILVDLPTAPTP